MEKGDGFLLQVIFEAICVKTGQKSEQRCRKWYISSHSCNSEIVRTALKAIEAAEIHELYENFTYKGARIFDPHLDTDRLANLIDNGFIGEDIR